MELNLQIQNLSTPKDQKNGMLKITESKQLLFQKEVQQIDLQTTAIDRSGTARYLFPDINIQESNPPQININVEESNPPQININAKESNPPQININVQESNPPQININVQESNPPQININKSIDYYTLKAQYLNNIGVPLEYVENLKKFLTTKIFKFLCYEFFILKVSLKTRCSGELITKFTNRAINDFICFLKENKNLAKHDKEISKTFANIFSELNEDDNIIALTSSFLLNPAFEAALSSRLKEVDVKYAYPAVVKSFTMDLLKKKHSFRDSNINNDFLLVVKNQRRIAKKILDLNKEVIVEEADFTDIQKDHIYKAILTFFFVNILLMTGKKAPNWFILLSNALFVVINSLILAQYYSTKNYCLDINAKQASQLLNNHAPDGLNKKTMDTVDRILPWNINEIILNCLNDYINIQIILQAPETNQQPKDIFNKETSILTPLLPNRPFSGKAQLEIDKHASQSTILANAQPNEAIIKKHSITGEYPLEDIRLQDLAYLEKLNKKSDKQKPTKSLKTNNDQVAQMPSTKHFQDEIVFEEFSITSEYPHQAIQYKDLGEVERDSYIAIQALSAGGTWPPEDIIYKNLTKIESNNGRKFYAYWDKKNINDNKYTQHISKLENHVNKGTLARSAKGSSGIKRLDPPIYIGDKVYTYEVKDLAQVGRAYGHIHYIPQQGFLVIFDHYDNSGRETGH